MPAIVRALERGSRAGRRQLIDLGEGLRNQRITLGLSQRVVASACGISRSRYTRMEGGTVESLGVLELARLASILGLDSVVRLYPGGLSIRDSGHARRLQAFLSLLAPPLRHRIEVPLPPSSGIPERRAWDAVLLGRGERTTIELEMRLRDVQATRRRHELKRRDDPSEHFLMLIADTRHNRRVLAEFEDLFADLPKLRPSLVRAALQAGRHPPTGFMLL